MLEQVQMNAKLHGRVPLTEKLVVVKGFFRMSGGDSGDLTTESHLGSRNEKEGKRRTKFNTHVA